LLTKKQQRELNVGDPVIYARVDPEQPKFVKFFFNKTVGYIVNEDGMKPITSRNLSICLVGDMKDDLGWTVALSSKHLSIPAKSKK
jgi:hypothetical protein